MRSGDIQHFHTSGQWQWGFSHLNLSLIVHDVRNGRKIETYKGARNINDLTDFVNTNKDQATGEGAADDGKVPDKKEAPKEESAVVRLDKDNFEEKTKSGVAFVKFYAPWCGHCQVSLIHTAAK